MPASLSRHVQRLTRDGDREVAIEDGSRLGERVVRAVPRLQVGEHKLANAGPRRVPGRLARGQVHVRPQVTLVEEGRLAQEDVAVTG